MENVKKIEKEINEFQENILSVNALKTTIENQIQVSANSLEEMKKSNEIVKENKKEIMAMLEKFEVFSKSNQEQLIDNQLKMTKKYNSSIKEINDKMDKLYDYDKKQMKFVIFLLFAILICVILSILI